MATTNLESKKWDWNGCVIKFHQIVNVKIIGALLGKYFFRSALFPYTQGDSEYELITRVEWTNQNTRNTIFGVENLAVQDGYI